MFLARHPPIHILYERAKMADFSMQWNKTYHRKKICVVFSFVVLACAVILLGRSGISYDISREIITQTLATDLQQRERQIKAARGKILDRNGVVLAG